MQPETAPARIEFVEGKGAIARRWRGDIIAVAALAVVIGVAWAIRWYYDNWLSDHDILTQYLIWFGYVGDRLRDLEVPAWMPYESSGTPFAGSPSNGWMFLYVMVFFPLISVIAAFKLLLITLSLTGAIALYAFGRRVGLSALAAFTSALIFATGPMLFSATSFRTLLFQVMTFIPVALLGTEMALRANRPSAVLGWSALVAIAMTQIFAIWPSQGILFSSMYVVAWLIYRALFSSIDQGSRRHQAIRATVVGAAAASICALLSAAAILPVLDFSEQSTIPGGDYSGVVGGDYVAAAFSWPHVFRDYLTASGDLLQYSLSTVTVVLAILGIVMARNRCGAPVLGILTLMFIDAGASWSLTRPVLHLIPMFGQIHDHRLSGTLPMVFPAVALLAGIGIQMLIDAGRRKLLLQRLSPLLVIGLALLIANHGEYSTGWVSLATATAAGIMILLPGILPDPIRLPGFRRNPGVVVALLLIAMTLMPFGASAIETFRNPHFDPEQANLISRDDWIQDIIAKNVARDDPGSAGEVLHGVQAVNPPFRYAPFLGAGYPGTEYLPSAQQRMDLRVTGSLANGRSTRLQLEQIPGFNAVHLKYYEEYVAAMNGTAQDYHFLDVYNAALDGSQLFDMLNVQFVIIPTDLVKAPPIAYTGEEVFRNDLIIVYQNPTYFQRAWMVHDVQPNNDGEGLAKLADGSVDGHITAFVDVDGPLPSVAPVAAGAESDFVTIDNRSQEMLKVKTASSADGLLVVSQSYADGWVAYVDGERTDVIRTNHALQGVPLAAGEHVVELKYEPASLAIGLKLTGFAIIAILFIWLWAFATSPAGIRVLSPVLGDSPGSTILRVGRKLRLNRILVGLNTEAGALGTMFGLILAAVGFRWYYDNFLADFDIFTQFLPWYGYIGDRLRDFEVPAWNPHNALGEPWAGATTNGWMYLPVMLVFPLFQVVTAFKLMVLLQSLIGGIATYVLGRKIGLNPVPAMISAVMFAAGPVLTTAAGNATLYAPVLAFIPVGVLGAEGIIQSSRWPGRVAWGALTGLAISQMVAEWPSQGLPTGLMYIGGWLAYRLLLAPSAGIGPRSVHLKRILTGGIAISVFAMTFSAAVLLPLTAISDQSVIPGGDYSNVVGGDYTTSWFSFSRMFNMLLADLPHSREGALSTATMILALFALIRSRNRFGIPFFVLMAFICIDLATDFSFTRWFFYLIPGFEHVHSHRPGATITFCGFGLAMAVGGAIQILGWERTTSRRYLNLIPPLAIGGLLIWLRSMGNFVGWIPVLITIVAAILLVVYTFPGLLRHAHRLTYLQRAIPFVFLFILLAYPIGTDYVRTVNDPPNAPKWENLLGKDESVTAAIDKVMSRRDPGTAAEFLQGIQATAQPFRYAPYFGFGVDGADEPSAGRRMEPALQAVLANARAARLGLEDITGYNPLHIKHYADYVSTMNGAAQDYHYLDMMPPAVAGNPLLDMLNVRYVLVDATLPADRSDMVAIAANFTEVYRDALVIVYENPNAFGRAWLVHDVQPAANGEELHRFMSGQVDGHVTAFVDGPLPAVAPLAAGATPDTVQIVDRSEEMLKIKASSASDGLVVISQPYASGWNAYVDGKQVDILRTNHALQGVPVAAGDHTIELRYEPQTLKVGIWISALSGLAMIVSWSWVLIDDLRRRRKKQ